MSRKKDKLQTKATQRDAKKKVVTCVYLNCCCTLLITAPQSKHLKFPESNSGRTSLVLVTTPLTDMSLPIWKVSSSLNLPILKTD